MRALLFLCLLLLALPRPAVAQDQAWANEVDVELFLAVDVSRSMSLDELEIQRQGYASALTSDEVLDAISRGLIGAVAVTYVEWAGVHSQEVIVPWTRLSTHAEAEAIAEIITANFENARRRTSISAILLHAANSILSNDFQGLRRVIDVSGDGPNNMGPPVHITRDKVLAQGIVINGLPLMTGEAHDQWSIPDLDAYYAACVTGGPGSFVLPVKSWDEFAPAVRRKLVLEIAGPAPDWPAPPFAAPLLRPAQAQNCFIGETIWERNTGRVWDY